MDTKRDADYGDGRGGAEIRRCFCVGTDVGNGHGPSLSFPVCRLKACQSEPGASSLFVCSLHAGLVYTDLLHHLRAPTERDGLCGKRMEVGEYIISVCVQASV